MNPHEQAIRLLISLFSLLEKYGIGTSNTHLFLLLHINIATTNRTHKTKNRTTNAIGITFGLLFEGATIGGKTTSDVVFKSVDVLVTDSVSNLLVDSFGDTVIGLVTDTVSDLVLRNIGQRK